MCWLTGVTDKGQSYQRPTPQTKKTQNKNLNPNKPGSNSRSVKWGQAVYLRGRKRGTCFTVLCLINRMCNSTINLLFWPYFQDHNAPTDSATSSSSPRGLAGGQLWYSTAVALDQTCVRKSCEKTCLGLPRFTQELYLSLGLAPS